MDGLICAECDDNNLRLFDYEEKDYDVFSVSLECRKCGNIFSVEMNENELNQWR